MNPLDKALADHLARTPLAQQAAAAVGEGGVRDWFRFQAKVDDPDAVDLYVYGVIGGWWSGVDADEFVRELRGIDAKQLNVHINSPGGSIFDGIAIFQALRNHKARIETFVDSLAASAASVIAMAGDRRVCAPYASLMVHKAWGLCIGNDDDMEKARAELARICRTMANLYATRSGGSVDDWLDIMSAETWYSADEAVEAGLVHEVQEDAEKTSDDEGDEQDAKAARWDLSLYAYAGRAKAPAPKLPGPAQAAAVETPDVPAAAPANQTQEDDMPLSAEVLQRLGLADGADSDAVNAAIMAVLDKPTEPEPDDTDADEVDEPAVDAPVEPQQPSAPALPEEAAAELRRLSAELAAIKAEKRAAVKATLFDGAVRDGKIKPGERAAWEARYDKAPEVIAEIIAAKAANEEVPVEPAGWTGSADSDVDSEYEEMCRRLDGPTAVKGS